MTSGSFYMDGRKRFSALLFSSAEVGDDPERDEQDAGDDVAQSVDVALVRLAGEEVDKLTGEDERHDDGDDAADADLIEGIEELGALALVDLVEHGAGLDLPADHQRHQHRAERHGDTL